MSGIFGGKTQSTTDPRLNAIQINQSAYGNAITLLYGQSRIPMTLGWYGSFTATPHTTKQPGGKGGGGGGGHTTYTYSAALVCLLCEGQINSVGTVWSDKEQRNLSNLGLTLFTGAGGQTAWSYLTTNFPAQAIPYDHTAYVANGSFELGGSAGLPNLTFEVTGLLPYNVGVINDAEASDILVDYCTDANHGAGFPFLDSGLQGAGVTTWESYCIAMSFFFSPAEQTQRPAVEFIKELMQMTNSAPIWSAGVLRVVPYADASVTGNSRTYTPDLTPQFAFGDDDYCPAEGDEPVRVTRKAPSETFNVVRIEFLDRTNQYNTAIAESKDENDIRLNGERPMPTINLHGITTKEVARQVAQLILQRQLYIRNEYTFRVRADYSLLEPMDLVSITDSVLGINNQLVRITETDDDEEDFFTITAEEMLVGTASAPRYNWQAAQGYAANYNSAPGSVATPLIFAMPPMLVDVNGGYELAIAVASANTNWGGCDVFWSLDNVNFHYTGTINGPARYGTLTATMATGSDPDTASALSVQLVNTSLQLVAASQADADSLRSLIYVDGEIMAHQYCTLTGAGAYTFTSNGNPSTGTKYMRRGKYGSAIASHANGSSFARLDAAIFRIPFDPGMIGQTVYFKFPSFNIYGAAQESLASVTAYSKVIALANGGQNLPGNSTFIARGNCVTVGDKLFKSGGSAAWDSDVRSIESYSAGCVLRFRVPDVTSNVMMALNSDPLTDQSYVSLDFAIYSTGGGTFGAYEDGVSVQAFGTYGPSDVFSLSYDGNLVRYAVNGVVQRTRPAPGKTFFFDSSFNSPGAAVSDVFFGPLNSATPSPYIARGNCQVSDTNVIKQGGSTGWDSDCYSIVGYPVCHVSAKANQANAHIVFGLTTDPTVDSNYTSIDYGWYFVNDGTLQIRENGTSVGSGLGSYTTSTELAITYDGATITYWKDRVSTRTVSVSGLTLFADSSFFTPGAGINSVRFGPTTNLAVADTAQIGANAATDVASTTASSVTITQVQHTPDGQSFNTQVASLTYLPRVDGEVLLTASGYATYTFDPAGLFLDLQYSLQVDSGYDGFQEQHWFISDPTPSGQYYQNISLPRRFAVTAGVSVTFKFMAAKFQSADTVTIKNFELRLEAIKR